MLIYVSLPFLALGPAVSLEAADLETGLVAHYKFDETEGTTAQDSSSNGHDGTLVNGPQWTAGKLGSAIEFDGLDDEVNVPYSADLNPEDAFTVTAWARADSQRNGYGAVISSRHEDSNGQRGFIVYASPNNMGLFFIGQGDAGWMVVLGRTIRLDQWVHLAAVYSDGIQRFYVDGVCVAENDSVLSINPHQDLLIGAGANEREPHEYFFQGAIDEVRIYNSALSEKEVVGLVVNDALRASFKAEEAGEYTQVKLALPRGGLRYALEVSENHSDLIWRRANPTVFETEEGDLGWSWKETNAERMALMRVAVETEALDCGELKVLLNANPIPSDGHVVTGDDHFWYQEFIRLGTKEWWGIFQVITPYTKADNVAADDPTVLAGFRPLGTRMYRPTGPSPLYREDQAMWMVKPSGGPYTGGKSPICEVDFVRKTYEGVRTEIWHAIPKEEGYVALGDYFGSTPPPEGSPNRPVAVREDLVWEVGDGIRALGGYS